MVRSGETLTLDKCKRSINPFPRLSVDDKAVGYKELAACERVRRQQVWKE